MNYTGVYRLGRLLPAVMGTAVLLASAAPADQPPLREVIDREVTGAWQREGVTPVGPADDATFLRRLYLDLTGTIPTYDEVRQFLEDPGPDKRSQWIDRLLDDPRFARQQADVWDQVLFGRNPPDNDARNRDPFHRWLQEQFAANVPYDQMVRQVLLAEGNTVDDGPPTFLMQYTRRPEDGVEAITETFLGVQLRCARCHDHPYEDWSQLDFYGMAAFLARLQKVNVGKQGNVTKYAVGELSTGEVLFAGPAAEQQPGNKGEPVPARFLLGEPLQEPPLPEDFEEVKFANGEPPPAPQFSRKEQLAEWITSPENPFFARAAANRVWAQFMGRGLAHPVDDMSEFNSPSHPELLEALATALAGRQFDLKWYIRELCNSRTYQLAAEGPVEEALPQWFQRARVRPLSAEELLQSWRVATGYDAALEASGKELPEDRFHGLTWGYMLRFFGQPTSGVGDFQGGLHEHLYLNNGQVSQLITRNPGGLYHTLNESPEPWPERVERLFLSTLSRLPLPEERDTFVEYLGDEDSAQQRLQEAIWTLITCSEFRFNH